MSDHDDFLNASNGTPPQRAPYNFAPISREILSSPIAGNIDHSRPVGEAICGSIQVTWKVETPLLVGGAGDRNNQPLLLADRYALPGASLRGMLRSVIEIAAFGRLVFYDDFVGYTRNTQGNRWKEAVPPGSQVSVAGMTGTTHPRARGAWLICSGESYALVPADTKVFEIARIVQMLRCDLDRWHLASLHDRLAMLRVGGIGGFNSLSSFLDENDEEHVAMLVVSGPTPELGMPGKPSEKKTEALFIDCGEREVRVDSETGRRFIQSLERESNAHGTDPIASFDALMRLGPEKFGDEDTSLDSQRKDLGRFGLPVFWRNHGTRPADTSIPTKDTHLSLTAMMRIPYQSSLEEVAQRTQPRRISDDLDLAQGLFGWAPPGDESGGEKQDRPPQEQSLRSRVKVGFAWSGDAEPEARSRQIVGARPQASFWPFYLTSSEKTNDPIDYQNPKARLAGRKRYAARHMGEGPHDTALPVSGNPEMDSALTFLKAGATFGGEIRVHNVTLVECGALLWAITLGQRTGTDGGLRHMLGRARGWGYGQLRPTITSHTLAGAVDDRTVDPDEAMEAFEKWVETELESKTGVSCLFYDLDPIRALLGMADREMGAAVSKALDLTRMTGKHDTTPAQVTLNAYAELKKRAEMGGAVSLPPYPRYRKPEGKGEGCA